ncbi:hypothetical protein F7731_00030 [Cytobacillus depressus]|uniref:Uncharacterized protein n=1 Tax=Cytobacillus depressus TaxID=1602942 RepID=A0A6L3VAB9_9BACI|nr:hypothetical protein [Cytobacillus depressus]KAB2338009.1 hypothetical protein F7731_00030 [Cytobacillus depressus]
MFATADMVAEYIGSSKTTILSRVKEFYGSFREAIVQIRGSYINDTINGSSVIANMLHSKLDEIYNVVGIREKTFPNLINPLTKAQLRIDYFIDEISLAIE